MKNSNWIPIISIIVAIGAGLLLFSNMQNTTNLVAIPALNSRVVPGTKITNDLLTTIQVDESAITNSIMPVLTSPDQIVGKIAYTAILENTQILGPQLVDDSQYLFEESKDNYFVTFGLDEIGVERLPYNFMKGKINICLITSNTKVLGSFPLGLPGEEMNSIDLQTVTCPVTNIVAVAMTEDNMLPWTYMTYDPTAQKYVTGAVANKIGFWLKSEEELSNLVEILSRPQVTNGITRLFFVMPPYNNNDPMVIENMFTTDPFIEYDLIYNPQEISENAAETQRDIP